MSICYNAPTPAHTLGPRRAMRLLWTAGDIMSINTRPTSFFSLGVCLRVCVWKFYGRHAYGGITVLLVHAIRKRLSRCLFGPVCPMAGSTFASISNQYCVMLHWCLPLLKVCRITSKMDKTITNLFLRYFVINSIKVRSFIFSPFYSNMLPRKDLFTLLLNLIHICCTHFTYEEVVLVFIDPY